MGLEEYWECTMNALTWPKDDGKGHGMDIIVDDGGDMTLLIHEGKKAEDLYEKNGTLPDPNSTENNELKIVLSIIRRVLLSGNIEKSKTLLFPAINVNDSVTKSKFDNLYGCKHSLPDGIMRATDVMMAGKKAVICGYGDVGKGCASAMRAHGCI